MAMVITAGKYSAATFEYAARVSFSYVKRGSQTFKFGVKKVTSPAIRVVSSPFIYFKKKITKPLSQEDQHGDVVSKVVSKNEEKIRMLEEKIVLIENKLAFLEKHGVTVSTTKNLMREKKNLTKEKSMLLQAIVNDNLTLKA